jgi:hypothetical protein
MRAARGRLSELETSACACAVRGAWWALRVVLYFVCYLFVGWDQAVLVLQ